MRNKGPIFSRNLSKRSQIMVTVGGVDVTPRPLATLYNSEETEVKINTTTADTTSSTAMDTGSKTHMTYSISKLMTALYKQTFSRKSFLSQSFVVSTQDEIGDMRIEDDTKKVSAAFMETTTPEEKHISKMPSSVSILLTETDTQFILDIRSKTVHRHSHLADAVEQANSRYQYLTVGKGRNRKFFSAETQTVDAMRVNEATEATTPACRPKYAFASIWDMHDTYAREKLKEGEHEEWPPAEKIKIDRSIDTVKMSQEVKEMAKLLENDRFCNAVCVVERLLANNTFNAQQKRFRGLSEPNPFRDDIEYNYRLDLLWTFANDKTRGQRVSAVAWSPSNSDILAVGYGKFYFTDENPGMVMLWNMKNPVQPERQYLFDTPVTSLGFAKFNPNLLAVGFCDGMVRVMDVSCREIRIIGQSSVSDFEPVWNVVWYAGDDYYKEAEQVMSITENGAVNKYKTRNDIDMECVQIMRVAKSEGKVKGIVTLRRCPTLGIPVTRYCAALTIRKHPVDPNIYFIGTNEGTVHRCSRNYYTQHLDLFLAHNGPMYVMKFSPFCNKLFLTCGDDWMVRIWADGVVEPLLELSMTMQSVQGADWSPTHSTVIVNICGADIFLWDLQRKAYLPQSVTHSPTNSRNTVIQFHASGRCLVVGDVEGNVHLFSLEDLPLPAFFQENLMKQSLLKTLITKPHIIKKLNKLGSLAFETK